MVHTWTVSRDASCIPESGCCFLFVPLFLHLSFSNFQTLKFFVTLFSGTVRPGRLILGTHVDRGQMYFVYTGIRLLLLIQPFISSVFFLSNFQTLKMFVALLSGTVRPIKLKLDTHMDIRWMYRVYRNQVATSYLSLISLFFFLSNVQKLKVFVTLFSGTVKPRNFKLGTLVDESCIP